MSDINIAIPVLVLTWLFFYPFSFSLFVSLYLMFCFIGSIGRLAFLPSDNLSLLIWAFELFTFKVIINMVDNVCYLLFVFDLLQLFCVLVFFFLCFLWN